MVLPRDCLFVNDPEFALYLERTSFFSLEIFLTLLFPFVYLGGRLEC